MCWCFRAGHRHKVSETTVATSGAARLLHAALENGEISSCETSIKPVKGFNLPSSFSWESSISGSQAAVSGLAKQPSELRQPDANAPGVLTYPSKHVLRA